jgi:hypothetical protein
MALSTVQLTYLVWGAYSVTVGTELGLAFFWKRENMIGALDTDKWHVWSLH